LDLGETVVFDLLSQIKPTDVIDILIVSYVIYKGIMLIRGTRAVQLLKGIFVVLIAWGLSVVFNLNTLQWLMNQAFTFGVLALIIIFQPELRRMLEQLGRGKLFSRAGGDDADAYTEKLADVIKAVNTMARKRIGALIVFERQTGLTDYMESGTAIGAAISSELLVNLFVPNTPLHDGAVIIRRNIIAAAACYLPLSENPFISRELGTRHRAAIGLSEVSDAICVVVSEETGQVSLVMNGQIVRDIKEESLIAKLYEELRPESKHKKDKPAWPFWKWRSRDDG
jgi:diadenylate cyclase